MAGEWTPRLHVRETAWGCRLTLDGVGHGNGHDLQEAADDLIERLLNLIMYMKGPGLRFPSELGPPDHRLTEYLWDLAERAGRGEDIRERVFGATAATDDDSTAV